MTTEETGPDDRLGAPGANDDPYLPAVGYLGPRSPRYRPRWEALIADLRGFGIEVQDWPNRPEGVIGEAQTARWVLTWQLVGEGAVLQRLEERWIGAKRRLEERRVPAVRQRGRPAWSSEVFRQHLREAEQRTDGKNTPTRRLAANFDTLNGELGMESDSLARLIRKFGRE